MINGSALGYSGIIGLSTMRVAGNLIWKSLMTNPPWRGCQSSAGWFQQWRRQHDGLASVTSVATAIARDFQNGQISELPKHPMTQ
jgi:hypothetical protein